MKPGLILTGAVAVVLAGCGGDGGGSAATPGGSSTGGGAATGGGSAASVTVVPGPMPASMVPVLTAVTISGTTAEPAIVTASGRRDQDNTADRAYRVTVPAEDGSAFVRLEMQRPGRTDTVRFEVSTGAP